MSQSRDDNLVHDGALGWIDPSDLLGSLGIDFEETERGFIYRDWHPNGRLNGRKVWMPKDRETLEVVRACLQDAEARIEARE
jgi:hypothetical protein